jgi:hypothetical protein
MPHHIVWQSIHSISGPLCHLGKALRLRLILKRVAREVDARAVNICFDNDVHAADAIEGDLLVLVPPPVAHEGHVFAICWELLVAFGKDDSLRERGGEGKAFG